MSLFSSFPRYVASYFLEALDCQNGPGRHCSFELSHSCPYNFKPYFDEWLSVSVNSSFSALLSVENIIVSSA